MLAEIEGHATKRLQCNADGRAGASGLQWQPMTSSIDSPEKQELGRRKSLPLSCHHKSVITYQKSVACPWLLWHLKHSMGAVIVQSHNAPLHNNLLQRGH